MKAMFWVKVKVAAAVFAAAAAVGGTGGTVAVKLAAGEPPKVEAAADEKGIRCEVIGVIPGGKVLLSAGAAQGVRAGFEFDVSRDGKKLGEVKAVAVEEKRTAAEVTSVLGEIKVGDLARTRFGVVLAQKDSAGKPTAPAEAGKIAWGEAVNGLQAGLVPLGNGATKDWKGPFCPNPKCGMMEKTAPGVGKCGGCAAPTGSTSVQYCNSCAAARRVCQGCGAAKPAGATFIEGEPIRLELHFKNVGERDLKLYDVEHGSHWSIVFAPNGPAPAWTAFWALKDQRDLKSFVTLELAKGVQKTTSLCLTDGWMFRDANRLVDLERPTPLQPLKILPRGKYTVTASYEHAAGHPQREACPYWHGKVTSGAVEIEVQAKGAANAALDFKDGEWNLRVNRAWAGRARFPSDGLNERDYKAVADGPVYRLVVSEDGARVAIGDQPINGARSKSAGGRVAYDLKAFAGGRFEVWPGARGLEGELTIYGSGVPIVKSERGPIEVQPKGQAAEPAAGAPDEAAARKLALKWIKDNNRDALWKDVNGGAPIAEEQLAVIPEPTRPQLWQVTVRFKKGGVFGFHIEKATGRIRLPVD